MGKSVAKSGGARRWVLEMYVKEKGVKCERKQTQIWSNNGVGRLSTARKRLEFQETVALVRYNGISNETIFNWSKGVKRNAKLFRISLGLIVSHQAPHMLFRWM